MDTVVFAVSILHRLAYRYSYKLRRFEYLEVPRLRMWTVLSLAVTVRTSPLSFYSRKLSYAYYACRVIACTAIVWSATSRAVGKSRRLTEECQGR